MSASSEKHDTARAEPDAGQPRSIWVELSLSQGSFSDWFVGGKILGPQTPQALREYVYHGGSSPLDRWVMSPFWDWCTRALIPTWVAPNLLTLAGGLCVALQFLVWQWNVEHLYNSEDIEKPAFFEFTAQSGAEATVFGAFHRFPQGVTLCADRWVYVAAAVLQFLYLTFDGCDGKQARRTHTSSPLGQLFDHGTDAVTTIPLILPCLTGCYGLDFKLQLAVFSVLICFFHLNWRTRHTGEMVFGLYSVTESLLTEMVFGLYSVTESLLTGMFVLLLLGLHPLQCAFVFDAANVSWRLPSWLTFLEPLVDTMRITEAVADPNSDDGNNLFAAVDFCLCFLYVASFWTILSNVFAVLKHYFIEESEARKKDKSKVKSTATWSSAVIELSHFWMFVVTFAVWALTDVISIHPWLFFYTEVFVFSGIIHRLIVADVCKTKSRRFHKLLLPLPFILLFSTIELTTGVRAAFGLSMASWEVVVFVCGFEFIGWLVYVLRVVNEICNILRIRMFHIKPRVE